MDEDSKIENNSKKTAFAPENAIVFAPEEFSRVFNLAMSAITHKTPEHDPSKQSFQIEEEDGSISEYRFTDIPIGRANMVFAEQYSEVPVKYFSMCQRYFALMQILTDKSLDKWRKELDDGIEIHYAVIDAAAVVTLTKEGEFPKGEFLNEVEKIIQEKYSDEDSKSAESER